MELCWEEEGCEWPSTLAKYTKPMSYKPRNNPNANPQAPYQSGSMPPVPGPSQSGQIPPVSRPYQSGQIPPVQAYPPQQTAQLPLMQPQAVGQVTGARTPRQPDSHSNLLRVGIVAAIIAALALIISLVLIIFKPFGLFEEHLQVDRPSTTQVEDAFEDANLPEPDLSAFAYVDDTDLERTSLKDFKASEVQYSKSSGSTEASCEATAEAAYENDSVSVKQTLTMRMDYDKSSDKWRGGSVHSSSVSASPEGPADINAITENFPNLLKTYDPKVAAMYVGGTTTADATLTAKGGTAVFTTTKTEGDTTRTCTANAEVTWSDTSGWNVMITSVTGDVEPPATSEEKPAEAVTPEPVAPSDSSSSGTSSGGNNNAGDGATMGLVCFTGELVEVSGTIQFDNSGAILLRTNGRYRVILDGRTYVVDYFEIGARAGGYHNGQQVTIIGEISYRGAIAQAPLFVNANY